MLLFKLSKVIVVLVFLFSDWVFNPRNVRQELPMLGWRGLDGVHLPVKAVVSVLLLSLLSHHLKLLFWLILELQVLFDDLVYERRLMQVLIVELRHQVLPLNGRSTNSVRCLLAVVSAVHHVEVIHKH